MKEYQINVIAGTKVLADMVETVKDTTFEVTETVKTVVGGLTQATAVVLAPGISGKNQKMEKVSGWFKNATGIPWEAPKEAVNTNWWNGNTWTLGSSIKLPTVNTTELLAKNEIKSTSINLFDKSKMALANTIVNSVGVIQAISGGVTAKIDISNLHKPDEDLLISWRGKLGANGPYYAFYNGSNLLSSAAYNNTLPKTVTAPATSTILYVTVKSAADAATVYDNFMINVGPTALAYKPYDAYINEIDGKKIPVNEGEAYDQPLNKADRVAFKEVTTDLVKTESLVTNEIIIDGLPKIGTKLNPPAGLIKGDPWLDTTDSANDPILRYRIV